MQYIKLNTMEHSFDFMLHASPRVLDSFSRYRES